MKREQNREAANSELLPRQTSATLHVALGLPYLLSPAGDKERLCAKVLCVPVAGGQQGALVTWQDWGLQGRI